MFVKSKFLLSILFIKCWILNTCLSPRAGVEIIRDWGCEDRSGGKPQEANWRQANVIDQMFASYTKGQWLWGRGRLGKMPFTPDQKDRVAATLETLRGP